MSDVPLLSVDVQHRVGSLDLDLAMESSASWMSIVGPSGAGKSTLLRILAGVAPAARGTIRFQGRLWMDSATRVQIPAWDRRVGWVPQDDFLFPNRSVLKNLTYGLRHRGPPSTPAGEVSVAEVSDLLGVTHLLERFPRNLSGGERQRVALGRALLRGPSLLLLDEPFAALDLPLRRTVAASLREFTDTHRVSAVLVSHDEVGNGTLTTERWVLTQGRLERAP